MITHYKYTTNTIEEVTLSTYYAFKEQAKDFVVRGGRMDDIVERYISFNMGERDNHLLFLYTVIYCYFDVLYDFIKRRKAWYEKYPYVSVMTIHALPNALINEIRKVNPNIPFVFGYFRHMFVDTDLESCRTPELDQIVEAIGDHPILNAYPYVPSMPCIFLYAILLDKYVHYE